MKAKELSSMKVIACRPEDSLDQAARLMWENDCGFVLATETGSGLLRGVVTDRDVCMAAYTTGKCLQEIPVGRVMQERVATCSPEDDVNDVQGLMRQHQVRRVPVIRDGAPVGVVSLNDLARAAPEASSSKARGMGLKDIGQTLESISKQR